MSITKRYLEGQGFDEDENALDEQLSFLDREDEAEYGWIWRTKSHYEIFKSQVASVKEFLQIKKRVMYYLATIRCFSLML